MSDYETAIKCLNMKEYYGFNNQIIIEWLNVCKMFKIDFNNVFHDNQIKSKHWLVENLFKYLQNNKQSNIFMFGGWYGILAYMLINSQRYNIKHIFNIDKDQQLRIPAYHFVENSRKYQHVVDDMLIFEYPFRPNVVINTSCEHLTKQQFIQWYNKIPDSVVVVLQSNNYDKIPEHVGCYGSLEEFRDFIRGTLRVGQSYLHYCDKLQCSNFERYMAIFKKPTGVIL